MPSIRATKLNNLLRPHRPVELPVGISLNILFVRHSSWHFTGINSFNSHSPMIYIVCNNPFFIADETHMQRG